MGGGGGFRGITSASERAGADPCLTSVFGGQPASPVTSLQEGNRSHTPSVGADPHGEGTSDMTAEGKQEFCHLNRSRSQRPGP